MDYHNPYSSFITMKTAIKGFAGRWAESAKTVKALFFLNTIFLKSKPIG